MKRLKIVYYFATVVSFTVAANIPYWNRINKQEVLTFLKQFVKPGDLVFDIGANIGKKADFYLRCGARVVCFEPQPKCLATLHRKFDANKLVAIEPLGLASKEGTATLYQCSAATTISSCSPEWTQEGRFAKHGYKWDKRIKITTTTLDTMIKKYGIPKFCKIDVEGFELDVLKGLSIPIPHVSFESNYECFALTKKCVEHLQSLGYKEFNFAVGERGSFLFTTWLPAEQFISLLQTTGDNKEQWEAIWGLWGDVYGRYEPKEVA